MELKPETSPKADISDASGQSMSARKQRYMEFITRFRASGSAMIGLIMLAVLVCGAIFAPVLAPYDPYESDLPSALQAPNAAHIMGTDELGRDIFSRILYGARISLLVGVEAVTLALLCGVIFGAVAGFYGGKTDTVIMGIMDIMLAFPSILLALAFMTVLGRGVEKAVIAIGIVSIPQYARIVRGSVLSVKENVYVMAARAIGNSDNGLIFRHILPNVLAPLIVRATIGVSVAILEAAALGFLGLGVQPPTAEWGTMLGSGRQTIFNAPHIVTFPGVAITLTVMAFNLLGDGLRDVLDPRLK
ncbi:MAG TPA: ABC transporter permease [Methylomusa anaerophila]|uniref:Glutathione transport system permease protein GsiD n=1 Tax=Methylomusa anaerophila TaxID=1930071 RepID=A0A348AIB6_9FIRM|nr:ABC transporter permease [Methylomusa anaerophila]BBB90814.1 glutathione transport system permease protein GsiD [Methylomusa anaerophila]HML90529.1 ABC transporter permease [Methylomusa anaerophila]